MAHFSKYRGDAAIGILMHDRRLVETNKSYIDRSRTRDNVAVDDGLYPDDVIRETGARCLKRANVNKMISLVVTCPPEITDRTDQIKFFGACINHMRRDLRDRSGTTDGELGAFCHFDETTPHMHYCFVPLVKDDRGLKVSAKEWLTKSYLQHFHTRLERDTSIQIGYNIRLQHEDARQRMQGRSASIKAYRMRKEMELQELESAISRRKEELRSYGIDPEQYKGNERARHLQVEKSILGR